MLATFVGYRAGPRVAGRYLTCVGQSETLMPPPYTAGGMEPALPGPVTTAQLERALEALASFSAREELTTRISELEHGLATLTQEQAAALLAAERIDGSILDAALTIKRLAGRINDIVHAVGILTALPHVLGPGEVIESLSLGAGNTGRAHDLETSRQIAEFKFIQWRGGPESIRQNQLFIDLFNLATADTTKRRVLYVIGKREPLRFLNGRRALASVLSKNAAAALRFEQLHSRRYPTVRDYYLTVQDTVEIIDLAELVPELRPSP